MLGKNYCYNTLIVTVTPHLWAVGIISALGLAESFCPLFILWAKTRHPGQSSNHLPAYGQGRQELSVVDTCDALIGEARD